ncbi:MAG: glycosyltransferase [Lachnospiraceae bacterium]|nr:glycosyltransferase [Lachnospiraceae bacterium]
MKIGIYLGYRPSTHLSLINEGLGRYLAKLVKVLEESGNTIVIACPRWLVGALEELLEEYNLSLEYINLVVPRKEPIIWRFIVRREKKKKKYRIGLKIKLFYASYDFIEKMLTFSVKIKSMAVTILMLLLFSGIGILLLPFVLIFLVLKGAYKLVKLFFRVFRIDLSSVETMKISIKSNLFLFRYLEKIKQIANGRKLSQELAERIRMDACRQMIDRIKHMKDKPDIWFCPMAFWSEFNEIDGVTVTCFPDLTPAFFPIGFGQMNMTSAVQSIRKTVKEGSYFITYCDYQKDQVLSNVLGKEKRNIRAIPLFVNETYPDIKLVQGYEMYTKEDPTKKFARQVLSTLFVNTAPDIALYLQGAIRPMSYKDIKYIFYSSQCRPNKNVLTLIKAYEYLLREKEVSLKLILTGSFDHIPEIRTYVYENRLQYDVLSFYHVNNQQLAALYACAELVVNPTLYEGGFLMIFSEGMSVGTPSVMSRIPQVVEITDQYDLEECLFDPYNYKDMAEKILYGIENRELLIEKQQPLYNKLSNRTKEGAAKEYMDAFQYFIQLDREEKRQRNGNER